MTKGKLGQWFVAKDDPPTVAHAAQTAVAAVVSYLIARLFRLPEAYWAPIATLIVMQSTLDAALPVSVKYFAGTAVGAAVGLEFPLGEVERCGCWVCSLQDSAAHVCAMMATYFDSSVWAFGVAVFIIGLLCVTLRVERSAFRYASITLVIVMLVTRSTSASTRGVALHRFLEVSIGLAVGLALFILWPKIGVGSSARTNHEARSSTEATRGGAT